MGKDWQRGEWIHPLDQSRAIGHWGIHLEEFLCIQFPLHVMAVQTAYNTVLGC